MDSPKRGDYKTVTPDFDDWLARQEVDIEDTLDIDSYQDWFAEQIGYTLTPKQQARVGKVYGEKYDELMPYGIRPITYTYGTGPREGQEETRWVIWNIPGLWSYARMREILEWMQGG